VEASNLKNVRGVGCRLSIVVCWVVVLVYGYLKPGDGGRDLPSYGMMQGKCVRSLTDNPIRQNRPSTCYRRARLNTLLHVLVHVLHNLLNVLVQIADKMGLPKRTYL
jgi:hypothetical protein